MRNILIILAIIAIVVLVFLAAGGPQAIYNWQHPLVYQWVATDNVGPLLQEIENNHWTWCGAVTCGNWTEISYRK